MTRDERHRPDQHQRPSPPGKRDLEQLAHRRSIRASSGWWSEPNTVGTAVGRVFVHPMDRGLRDRPRTAPNQDVVEHQPGERMVGVPPGGHTGGTPKWKPASCRSRQAGSARPRPRLRSAPSTAVSSSTAASRWRIWTARPAAPSQRCPTGPRGSRWALTSRTPCRRGRAPPSPPPAADTRTAARPRVPRDGQRGQDRVAPIAPLCSVPHRRGVAQAQSEPGGDVSDVLPGSRPYHHLARRPAVGALGDRRIGAEGLLQQDHQRQLGLSAQPARARLRGSGVRPRGVAPSRPRRSTKAPAAMRAAGAGRGIVRDRVADVGTPALQPAVARPDRRGKDVERRRQRAAIRLTAWRYVCDCARGSRPIPTPSGPRSAIACRDPRPCPAG